MPTPSGAGRSSTDLTAVFGVLAEAAVNYFGSILNDGLATTRDEIRQLSERIGGLENRALSPGRKAANGTDSTSRTDASNASHARPQPRVTAPEASKLCVVEGCERAASARGVCKMHYQRLRYWERHGDDAATAMAKVHQRAARKLARQQGAVRPAKPAKPAKPARAVHRAPAPEQPAKPSEHEKVVVRRTKDGSAVRRRVPVDPSKAVTVGSARLSGPASMTDGELAVELVLGSTRPMSVNELAEDVAKTRGVHDPAAFMQLKNRVRSHLYRSSEVERLTSGVFHPAPGH